MCDTCMVTGANGYGCGGVWSWMAPTAASRRGRWSWKRGLAIAGIVALAGVSWVAAGSLGWT